MFLEIISDIFGRLHYMERRGSGIQRIMNSYTDFVEQPEFYSDDTQFLVTMPNRGVATLVEKSPLLDQESSLQGGKSSLQKESSISSIEVVLIDLFSKDTSSKIGELYKTHGFKYSFNRENLAKILNSSSSYASRIISKCKQNGIMRMEKRGVYYFQKPVEDDQEE